MLNSLISILILIGAVLLTLIVLIQNSKGGGLASNFSSSNQFMGVRKTTDVLERFTWYIAIGLVILSVSSTFTASKPKTDVETEKVINLLENPVSMPAQQAPEQTGQQKPLSQKVPKQQAE